MNQVKINEINTANSIPVKCPEYHTLTILNSENLVERTKIKDLVGYRVQEVLFDLIQYSHYDNLDFQLEHDSLKNVLTSNASLPIAMLNVNISIQEAQK